MRTGRARLTEWVEDILDQQGDVSAEEWTDRIMDDINRGIIAPETTSGNDDLDEIVYRGMVPTEGLTTEEEL